MASGGWVAASLHTAAVLGIAELLAAGPRSVEEIRPAGRIHDFCARRQRHA
jgi:hypothetical protein